MKSQKNSNRNGAKQSSSPPFTQSSVKTSSSTWKTLIILSFLTTMVMYGAIMIISAIPDLIAHFHVSYGTSSWILSSYLIAGAVMTPIAGKLSDIYGKKKILVIVMIIYAAGLSIAGVAPNIYVLIIARGIQGIGMSIFAISYSIVKEIFPRTKLSIGQGVISSMYASGAVLGMFVGGMIIKYYGWEATFFSILPIAITLLIVICRLIHLNDEKRDVRENQLLEDVLEFRNGRKNEGLNKSSGNPSIDIEGAITLSVAIISFLLVLTTLEISGTGGNSPIGSRVIIFLTAGIISFSLFILVERRTVSPLVDIRLMLHKAILPANLIFAIVGFFMFIVFQSIPILVRNPPPLGFGKDAVSTGNIELPFALILLVFGPTSGFIISKLGVIKPVIAGATITSAGFLSLFLFHSTTSMLSVNLAIISIGLSLASVGALNVTMLSTPKQFTGISMGTSMLMRILGSALAPSLSGMYMQANQSVLKINGVAHYFPSGESYNLIFLTATIISIFPILLGILIRRSALKMETPGIR
jgi:MFS family permease